MKQSGTFSCNKIFFQADIIPFSIDESGTSFFSTNRQESWKIFHEAMWGGSVSSESKNWVINELTKSISFHSNYSRLGDIFVLSMLHRSLSIFASSAKLYIDKTKWRAQSKFIASTAITLMPYAFLVLAVGHPLTDILLNAAIVQGLSVVLAFYSHSLSNYLRCLDLISYDKAFGIQSYASRLATSSFLDIGLTLILYGKRLYNDPWMQVAEYNLLRYCVGTGARDGYAYTSLFPALPLVSITDKLVWVAGKVILDTLILSANKFQLKWFEDIRSPFINALKVSEKKYLPIREESKPKQKKRFAVANSETIPELALVAPSLPISATEKKVAVEEQNDPKKDKVKHRPVVAAVNLQNVDKPIETTSVSRDNPSLVIDGLRYYLLPSSNPSVYIGVLNKPSLGRVSNINSFESCLRTGTVGSARITLLGNVSELRPSGDARVIGRVYSCIDGPNTMYPLAEALEVYDQLNELYQNKTPRIIPYDRYVAKHNALHGAIQNMR